ncbi:MAG: hypothetical protein J6S14_17300 [Clostridia bacterium]|nr:hypothetical protein [Clostridia bacterium]
MDAMECTVIFDKFRNKVSDYDLLDMCPSYEEAILYDYLLSAAGDFMEWTGMEFSFDKRIRVISPAPTDRQADILALGMLYYWTSHILHNTDKMRNVMNTRDFQQFSPEKILARLSEIRDSTYTDFKARVIDHSFITGG